MFYCTSVPPNKYLHVMKAEKLIKRTNDNNILKGFNKMDQESWVIWSSQVSNQYYNNS